MLNHTTIFKLTFMLFCLSSASPTHSADCATPELVDSRLQKIQQNAFSLCLKNALSGENAEAFYHLSEHYRHGKGCAQNTQRADFFAEHYLKMKGNGNDLLALAGLYHAQDTNDSSALTEKTAQYLKMADQYFEQNGTLDDWVELSFIFRGDGVLPKDPERVTKYFYLAEKGLVATRNPEVLITLALAYLNDDIIPKNVHKALVYLESAANLGNTEACIHLAKLYLDGKVINKDPQKFFHYVNLHQQIKISKPPL